MGGDQALGNRALSPSTEPLLTSGKGRATRSTTSDLLRPVRCSTAAVGKIYLRFSKPPSVRFRPPSFQSHHRSLGSYQLPLVASRSLEWLRDHADLAKFFLDSPHSVFQ